MNNPRNNEPTAEEIHAITGRTDVKHVATADTARGLVEAVKEAEAAPEPADLPEQEPPAVTLTSAQWQIVIDALDDSADRWRRQEDYAATVRDTIGAVVSQLK